MAEQFIEEVYFFANIISRLRVVVERYRFQEDYRGTELIKKMIPLLEKTVLECCDQGYEEADLLKEKLLSLKEYMDGISIADLLESSIIPIMERWMQTWIAVDEQMDERYKIESTSSGFLTIKDIASDCYLHSNNNPMEEARKIVERQFDYSKKAYVVWGCGLGYHIYQLYQISEGTIPIILYETNLNLVRYALNYGVLSWIPKELLEVKFGYSAEEFLKNADDTKGIFLLQPYVNAMKNEHQRDVLKKYVDKMAFWGKENYLKDISKLVFPAESYRCAYIISLLHQVVDYCRIMDEKHARDLMGTIDGELKKFIEICGKSDDINIDELEESVLMTYRQKDLVLLGDIIENAIIPIMKKKIQLKDDCNKVLDERYKLERTETGYWTIRDITANVYLHSKCDPMSEARRVNERQYNDKCKSYVVWGCGLGYHIYQLYVISKGEIPITLYERNSKMIEYAYSYGVLSWVPKDVLNIIIVNDAKEFLANVTDGSLFLNSYIQTDDKEQRNLLNMHFARFIFGFDAAGNLRLNYFQNKFLNLPCVYEIDHSKLKKDMVVIGGGPSLDHFMDTLKSWQGKKTIIAAGTVWKKLLKAGIKPDFVVIMDPYDIVYQQVENIEDTSATLLLTMQANWRVGKNYPGKKYLIPHLISVNEIDEKIAGDYKTLFFSGGSVTVFELEFAVRMFADRIYFLGVDLSLPGGMTHAEGTKYRHKVDVSELIPVEDVNGKIVYTDHALIDSITWFEMIMSETEGIEYINMSDVGVKLKGTIPYKGKPDKE